MKMKKKPLTNKAGQVRELTSQDIRNMRPASEVLPSELLKALPKRSIGQRGKQKNHWQSRIDKILKEWVKKHPKSVA